MTFQKGGNNPRTHAMAGAKAKVLALVAEGHSVHKAMEMCGKKPDTVRIWCLRDKKFAADLAEAKATAKDASLAALGIPKEEIDFPKFSEIFLQQRVFPHHMDWIDLLEDREPSWLHPSMVYEKGDPARLLLNVPPEHAKSTVITVNYSTYRIALNPNIRIIVVSKTLIKAREFVYAIKQRLSHPRWLKLQTTFGPEGGWKEDSDTWRVDTVYLGSDARNSSEKDPTIQALGMGGQIYGARADLIILDDCITTANAHEYEKQINWLQKEVITRLGKNGKLLIVGTRIAAQDFYKELREAKHWSGGKSPFTYMGMPAVLEYSEKPEDWKTLWPKSDLPWDGDTDVPDKEGFFPKWDGKALFRRRSEVTPQTWALVYQQEDVSEDSIFPPAIVQGCINGQRKRGLLKAGAVGHPSRIEGYTIIGFDPAMGGNAAFVVATYNRADSKIYVLDCVNMSDPTPQKIQDIIEHLVEKYKPPNFGVAGMSMLMGTMRDEKFQKNNIIEFPSTDNSEGMKALVQQLITWKPNTRGKTDCVMALWFVVLRAREFMQQTNNISRYAKNRWATRAQTEKRYSVNLDEAFAEQWQQTYG